MQEYEAFEVDASFVPGDIVHLLVMRWDDGDSYGHSNGHGEVLWAFKDHRLAREALLRWQYACDYHGEGWCHDNKLQSISFRVDGGRFIQLNNPAYDGFCHVQDLYLDTRIVQF